MSLNLFHIYSQVHGKGFLENSHLTILFRSKDDTGRQELNERIQYIPIVIPIPTAIAFLSVHFLLTGNVQCVFWFISYIFGELDAQVCFIISPQKTAKEAMNSSKDEQRHNGGYHHTTVVTLSKKTKHGLNDSLSLSHVSEILFLRPSSIVHLSLSL